jgi:SAM-dependent methyltransferase
MDNFIDGHRLNYKPLLSLLEKPPVFEPDGQKFWDDPYISGQMLAAHLDPETDAASRRPESIDCAAAWIAETVGLQPGDSLLDLGCGPGLYARRWSAMGLDVTGVDCSARSVAYARAQDPKTTYLHRDFFDLDLDALDLEGAFDAVAQVYGEVNTFDDARRDALLAIVRRALKSGGYFAFDVSTWFNHHPARIHEGWSAVEGRGFWKPNPYLELRQVFEYPEHDTTLEQYIIIEDDGTITTYRNWFHYYTVETITAALEGAGFVVEQIAGDLCGAPYKEDSAWIGVVARKL